jgi:sulfotransferase family protein
MTPAPDSGFSRTRVRIVRHLRWARREGVGRLIEEDQLDPRQRRRLAAARKAWLAEHSGIAPNAQAVFLVGVQRSGTNMLVRGFETSPAFDVCNENDKRAFVRFRLRPLDDLRALIEGDGHRWILLKPLAESHRIVELLDLLGTPTPPKALWAYRGVDGRVRSAVSKFGPNNLLALRAIVAGATDRAIGVDAPSQEIVELIRDGLSAESLAWLRGLDLDAMDAAAGAAAFWCVRNALYFELGLHERDDVIVSSYDRVIGDPEGAVRPLCSFLGVPFEPALVAHVQRRGGPAAPPLSLPEAVRERCDELTERLAQAETEKAARFSG